jgi:hypothetical protein
MTTKKEAVGRLKRVAKVMFADILDTVLYRLNDHFGPDEVSDDAKARRQVQGYMQRWVFEDIAELGTPERVEDAFQNTYFHICSRRLAGEDFRDRYLTPAMRLPAGGVSDEEARIRTSVEFFWLVRFDEMARGVR